MDKNTEITIRKVGNGWMVVPGGFETQHTVIPIHDILVFQHLATDQLGVQTGGRTLFGFLAEHFPE